MALAGIGVFALGMAVVIIVVLGALLSSEGGLIILGIIVVGAIILGAGRHPGSSSSGGGGFQGHAAPQASRQPTSDPPQRRLAAQPPTPSDEPSYYQPRTPYQEAPTDDGPIYYKKVQGRVAYVYQGYEEEACREMVARGDASKCTVGTSETRPTQARRAKPQRTESYYGYTTDRGYPTTDRYDPLGIF